MNDFIDYSCISMDERGVYCVGYAQIERAVEKYLQENHPEVLLTPQRIPIEEWIDSGEYGFILDMRNIAYPQAKGITAFSKMAIWSIDSETNEIRGIPIEESTIVIDESLPPVEIRFTAAHEVVHIKMHSYYFMRHSNAIAANSNVISLSSYLRKPIWWLERQANYGAGALLMPRVTLSLLFKIFFRTTKTFKIPKNDPRCCEFVNSICEIYDVSMSAARIRLEQLDLLEE